MALKTAVLVLACWLIAACAWGVEAVDKDSVTLDSGKLRLIFATADGVLRLNSLTDAAGTEWLSDFGKGSLWAIALQGPRKEVKELRSSDAAFKGVSGAANRAEFTWEMPVGEGNARVTMTVRCEPGSAISYWRLRASLPNGWQISRCDFPLIPNINMAAASKLCTPTGWGLERDVKPGLKLTHTYPGLECAMQFYAFYGRGRGLYLGMHDAQANHKALAVEARTDGVEFRCINWPAVTAGAYELPYEASVGVFDGDYYDAAQIYRRFTFDTPWGKAAPISKRPIARWLKDTELWLMPGSLPLENLGNCKKAGEYFGVPIALHWYCWHQIPFDTLYPDYFPAREHFEEGVKALQAAGFHAMPYINGRLCDPNSKFWTEEHADKAAARKPDGEPYTEVYGSKVALNVMCPYTSQWQDKIAGLVDRLVNQCGVDAVYIDQICAAAAVPCFDTAHGHPIGGGRFWVDGYRKMLDLAKARLPKDAVLTTEENTECWLDQLDALLMVNTPPTRGKVIPLFPSVYSGRTVLFGFQYLTQDDFTQSLPFRSKMARAFVWGSQLGWVGVDHMIDPKNVNEAEFLRNLARCRRFGHEYLLYGRFLGNIDVFGDNPRVTCKAQSAFGGAYKLDTRSVLASAWLAEDGSLGVALANLSDEPRTVEVKLPLAAAAITPGSTLAIEQFGPEGPLGKSTSDSAMQKLTIPARGAVIVSISVDK